MCFNLWRVIRTQRPRHNTASSVCRSCAYPLARRLSSGNGKPPTSSQPEPPGGVRLDDGDVNDEEDEFSMISAIDDEAAAQIMKSGQSSPAEAVDVLSRAPQSISQEDADALVSAMVSAASKGMSDELVARAVPPPLTVHTLEVLRCSRISTNKVFSVVKAGYKYPISQKVSAQIDLKHLGLSRLARAALEEISGPRLREDVLTINVQKFATSEENVVHIIGLMARVVEAAKTSVGESFDSRVLESWEDVLSTVRLLTRNDSEGVTRMVNHLASLPEPSSSESSGLVAGGERKPESSSGMTDTPREQGSRESVLGAPPSLGEGRAKSYSPA